MVDYLSRYRLYGLGYSSPSVRQSAPSYSELYATTAPYLFKTGATQSHDCRVDAAKKYTDRRDWETQLMCHGLRTTCADLEKLQTKQKEPNGKKKPDKLLFNVGIRGKSDGDFRYPRGLAITDDSDLVIADTMNHRVQILNQCGIMKSKFGRQGSNDGNFLAPTGVAIMPNDDVVVADSKNKRIQVFSQDGRFKYKFSTVDMPHSVACDKNYNIMVGTMVKTVEVYRRGGKLSHRFETDSRKSKQRGKVPVFVCSHRPDEIILLDPELNLVKFFSADGKLLYKFRPQGCGEGLTIATSSICVTPIGHVIVADSLNHSVSLYSERGSLLQQIVGPPDEVGPVQTCGVGPEGHLVVTEYSVSGEHCVKIFRFQNCICHLNQPGSSKRRTPTGSGTQIDRVISRLSVDT